jgi:hypothetical protein
LTSLNGINPSGYEFQDADLLYNITRFSTVQ